MLPTLTTCVGVPVAVDAWLDVGTCEVVALAVPLREPVAEKLLVVACDLVAAPEPLGEPVTVWLAVGGCEAD